MPAAKERDASLPAVRIRDKFGGLSKWCAAYDPPLSPSTVSRWLDNGFVPGPMIKATKEAARRQKIALTDKDFMPLDV